MKPYAHTTGQSFKQKYNTQAGPYCGDGRTVVNKTDGTVIKDKTAASSSRPSKKRTMRNANRAHKKSTRQALKKETDWSAFNPI